MLLDTHTLLWAVILSKRLSPLARSILSGKAESFYLSTVSAWEIATKFRLGKLPEAELLLIDFPANLRAMGIKFLAPTVDHALLAGSFPMTHKDPFDRLIAAQAKLENIPLLSADPAFDQFPIQRIW